jgi:uncharacterized membrane protein
VKVSIDAIVVANRKPVGGRLYRVIAIISAIVVFVGFSRSYFLRPLFRNTPLELALHLHGAIMTLWFLLFALQVSLVANGRSLLHQSIGVAGAVLAALLSVLALLITVYSAKQIGDFRPPTPFLGLVLISFIPFPILVGSAIHYRRQSGIHKRLMLLATVSILGAALVRFPMNFSESGAAIFMLGGTDVLVLGSVAFDTVKHRRLHPAFAIGSLCVLVFQLSAALIAPSDAWATALAWLTKTIPGSL